MPIDPGMCMALLESLWWASHTPLQSHSAPDTVFDRSDAVSGVPYGGVRTIFCS